ncbi:uncharacterized protein J7T55_015269 [Diaporthe amygdali]|uniref:uncharacterized protein n=1 Tax=Phomopsis amygdali TaxID=1214568 RepID=UPI0022FED1A5|nr:uncharacterized protein J7T55_015269 [Diaporthe amygdali]KAJ0120540.1 uncharacterized protein J7T55_015269 [Diaporthe amygdali]
MSAERPTGIQTTALVTGSFLSGAMMSLSFIAVPVLLETTRDAPQLLTAWTRTYHYGHLALPTMSVGTFLLYIYAARASKKGKGRSRGILAAAGVATVAMVPFTWAFMLPTNDELFRLQAASVTEPGVAGFDAVREMVTSWSWMHVMRSLMPLVGAILGASAILAG